MEKISQVLRGDFFVSHCTFSKGLNLSRGYGSSFRNPTQHSFNTSISIFRPPGTTVPDGLMFHPWCFFHREISELPPPPHSLYRHIGLLAADGDWNWQSADWRQIRIIVDRESVVHTPPLLLASRLVYAPRRKPLRRLQMADLARFGLYVRPIRCTSLKNEVLMW